MVRIDTFVQSTDTLVLSLSMHMTQLRMKRIVMQQWRRVAASGIAATFMILSRECPASTESLDFQATPAATDIVAVQPSQLVDSFEKAFGVHPGLRRNHAKGTCASGEFVGSKTTQELSRSALFQSARIAVLARFSVGGGNPAVADVDSALPRGMALEFRLPGGTLQHMTMVNIPIFGAATPASFNDALVAARADPDTGRPDPKRLDAYMASHPDAHPLAEWSRHHRPTASYYQSIYYGIHTFLFVDVPGTSHPVRWRFVPRDGVKELSAAEMASAPHDFLESGLIERLRKGAVLWDMVVYVGEPGDPIDNPSLAWPESRRHFVAGTLSLSSATPQQGAACENINFDPLVMSDGIAASNDPVLLFRSPAYAVSFGKRISGQ
jgi:catalase